MNRYQEIYIPYKDIAFFLIFSLSLVMPIVPFEFQLIFSIFSLSIIFLMSNKTFNKQGFNFIKPLLIILLVAIASGFGNFISGDFYFYLRDGYYLLQPLIYIFIGYFCLSIGIRVRSLLRLMLITCALISIYIFFDFFVNLISGYSIGFSSRYDFALDSDFAVLGFAIIFISIYKKFNLFSSATTLFLLFLFLFLVISSFSRTNLLIVFVCFMYPLIDFFRKVIGPKLQVFTISVIILVPIFLGSVLNIGVPEEEATDFFSKVMNSYSEILVRDYTEVDASLTDTKTAGLVNIYWRSQEAFLGIQKYLEGNSFQLVFGQGLGSYATGVDLYDDKYETIPFFHNGFVTILLKAGPIGLMLFFQFIFYLLTQANKSKISDTKKELVFIRSLVGVFAFIILIKTFFIMGIYTPEAPVVLLIIIGALVRHLSDENELINLKKNV